MRRLLFALVVSLFSSAAFADPAIVIGWGWYNGNTTTYYPSAASACSANSNSTVKYAAVADASTSGYHCQGTYVSSGSSPPSLQQSLTPQWGCVTGATPNMNYPAPQQCPTACVPGRTTSFYTTTVVPVGFSLAANPVPAYPVSDGHCAVVIDSVGSCGVYGTTEECLFNAHQTGSALSIDPNWQQPTATPPSGTPVPVNTPPVKASSCPGGTTQAGLDPSGIPVCYGSGIAPLPATTTTSTSPATTTTNSDGSTTGVATATTTNSDGSVTTTTTTTNTSTSGGVTISKSSSTSATPGGAPGTPDTPVSTPSSGSGGSSSSPDPSLGNLCKTNPNLNICHNSSVSGSCGQVACTGDAIQCATLRAAAAMQCQQQSDINTLSGMSVSATGAAILAGSDPDAAKIAANQAGTSVDMSNPGANIDSSGFAPASCLADRQISILGHQVTISFSQYCPQLANIKPVVLALASLVWVYIVFGASNSGGDGFKA